MSYIVGISSGIFGAASQEELQALSSVGLAKKAQYAITKGVNFVQIDLESISEFEENDIEKKMKEIEKLGITFAIHSETVSFGSREFPHLDSAIKPDYRRGHERLITILKNAGKIGVKYVLTHSSESIPFQFLNREFQPTELVDPWGRNLADFINSNKKIFVDNEDITKTWLWNQDEIWKDVLHDTPQGILERNKESRLLNLREYARRTVIQEKINEKKIEKIKDAIEKEFGAQRDAAKRNVDILRQSVFQRPEPVLSGQRDAEIASAEIKLENILNAIRRREEELKNSIIISKDEIDLSKEEFNRSKIETEVGTLWKNEEIDWKRSETDEILKYFLRLIQSRQLSYGPERIAYYVMAKWMQEINHPLWRSIIDITIKYYAKKESTPAKEVTPEQWLRDRGMEISIDNKNFQQDYRLWVPAVSALYVYGHFCPEDKNKYPVYDEKKQLSDVGFTVENPKKILEEKKYYFIFETPMAGSGMEDLLRFPQPGQIYYLVRQMNSPWFGVAIDIQHMLMDGLNVEAALAVLPQDSGKWIRVIHSGYPSPLGPHHIPIPLGSDQQMYLYKTYWNLRQKGTGKDNEVFLIFERGGGQDPVQQTIIALKLIKKFLEADVPPEKLPLEFYGLDTGQWASSERQKAQIIEHAFEPLKGMLQVPEEEHGFLGKTAIEKGKGEEWRKEKYR
jgi:hypothetical protein